MWWALAVAWASPWEDTFQAEMDRGPEGDPRRVVAIGDGAELPAAALCEVLEDVQLPCTISFLPPRAARHTDAWLALQQSTASALVYVLRPNDSTAVSVSVFHGAGNRIDAYVAEPLRRANTRVELAALWERIDRLEARVDALTNTLAAPLASTEEEEAARAQLATAVDAANALQPEAARTALASLASDHPHTRAGRSVPRLQQELQLVGRPAAELPLMGWIQGSAEHRPQAPTLYVFWELWCPHCQRELPRLQPLLERHPQLQIVGLTKLSREVERADVEAFLSEHGVRFPVAQESGELSEHYGVRGIPAAAMVVDGTIIWRGHPAHLDDEMIERFLGAP